MSSIPSLNGKLRQSDQFRVGPEEDRIETCRHLHQVGYGNTGKDLICRGEKGHLCRIAQVEKLEVVLPAQKTEVDQLVVFLQKP